MIMTASHADVQNFDPVGWKSGKYQCYIQFYDSWFHSTSFSNNKTQMNYFRAVKMHQ